MGISEDENTNLARKADMPSAFSATESMWTDLFGIPPVNF
jgi:hypothetical protein